MSDKIYSTSLSRMALITKNSMGAISDYIFSLGEFDSLKLSLSFEEIKSAHSKYRDLLSALLKNIDEMDAEAAQLSGAICTLERDREITTAKRLSTVFEAYLVWKKALGDFVTKCDSIFKNKGVDYKLSQNVLYTRTLIAATEQFMSALSI